MLGMTLLARDLRFAARSLRRSPGFALGAIVTVALGIGSSTAMFSVADAMFVRSLPFRSSDDLVHVGAIKPSKDDFFSALSPADFAVLRERTDVFREMAVSVVTSRAMLAGGGGPAEELAGREVSPEFFSVAGIEPALGRKFSPADTYEAAPRTVILSERLWRQRFGGRPQVVGDSIRLNDTEYVVVGVLPAEWARVEDSDFWLPYRLAEDAGNRNMYLGDVLGRLQAGVSFGQAQAAVDVVSRALEREHPESNRGYQIRVVPIRRYLIGVFWTPLVVILGAVGFVLLIACANVANLLLARTVSREREIAIRKALGASRPSLIRRSVAEALSLALCGAAASLPLAWWLIRLLRAVAPSEVWQLKSISMDWRVLAFCVVLTLATALAVGLVPAGWVTQASPTEALKAGQPAGRHPFGRRGIGSGLVVAEIALAFPLLIGSGLMIQSLWRLQRANLGFRFDRLMVAEIRLPRYRYPEEPERREFFRRVLERVGGQPGIEAVGAVSFEPVGPFGAERRPFRIDGHPSQPGEEPEAGFKVVDSGYFRTVGLTLLRGRTLTDTDDERSERVVLVSESFRSLLARGGAVGERLQIRFPGSWETVTIVGVVSDVASWPEVRVEPTIYMSFLQRVVPPMSLVVRSPLEGAEVERVIRREVAAVDPDQSVRSVRPMDGLLGEALGTWRFVAFLLKMFGALALALAAVGNYAVMSYLVVRRRSEIGIRTALGARKANVLALFVGQSLRWAAVGIAIGAVVAVGLTRFLVNLLFGVTPTDVRTLALCAAVLLLAGVSGGYVPARRAAGVDPMIALRGE
jgi:putative ABC transport system permease protein